MPADPQLIPGVLQRWAGKQLARLRGAFLTGGHHTHGGERWVTLDPATGTRTPLVLTGSLMEATFARVSGLVVHIGNSSPIAIYHQNGTRSIPKRPIVVVTRSDLNELKQDLKKTLEA
ncbi:MAG: hypothetical protein M5U25_21145 [Planctomycetota bacterium]|nr:hypothetical protein [Planctomycetota bacterium]